jgi:phospholipase C
MMYRIAVCSFVLAAPIAFAQSSSSAPLPFPPQIKNVVVIFQENRTPDNLFHELGPACPLPPKGGDILNACIPEKVTDSCYDISPCGISNQSGTPKVVTLKATTLAGSVDPDHSHNGFYNMCDPDPVTLECRNEGAWKTSSPAGSSYAYVYNAPVTNSDGNAGHLLEPYITLAKDYGWANFMYQTNQGPSYPAHQFIFTGTSAPTAEDDKNSTFIAENFDNKVIGSQAGCLALEGATNKILSPAVGNIPAGCTLYDDGSVKECTISNTALKYPGQPVGTFCYQHQSMADLLDPRAISWKYYAPSAGSIWTAPDSIKAICEPAFADPKGDPSSALECTGKEWDAHVDIKNLGTDILRDIASCSLSRVSWVIPNGEWSDHAGAKDYYGPSWVAAVINAIGNNPTCGKDTPDAGEKYWEDTAIIVTWDDWGGWSDNQPARYASKLPCKSTDCEGDYQYGFRVPLIVVSAYTPAGYINNVPHDFGSILRMIEGINHIKEGSLGFADDRATTALREFFTLPTARGFKTIPAEKDAQFFLNQTGAALLDPDDY